MIFSSPVLGSYPSVCAIVAIWDRHGIGVPREESRIVVWSRHVPPLDQPSPKLLLFQLPSCIPGMPLFGPSQVETSA